MTEANFEPTHDLGRPVVLAEGDDFEMDCLKPSGIPPPSIRSVN